MEIHCNVPLKEDTVVSSDPEKIKTIFKLIPEFEREGDYILFETILYEYKNFKNIDTMELYNKLKNVSFSDKKTNMIIDNIKKYKYCTIKKIILP